MPLDICMGMRIQTATFFAIRKKEHDARLLREKVLRRFRSTLNFWRNPFWGRHKQGAVFFVCL